SPAAQSAAAARHPIINASPAIAGQLTDGRSFTARQRIAPKQTASAATSARDTAEAGMEPGARARSGPAPLGDEALPERRISICDGAVISHSRLIQALAS